MQPTITGAGQKTPRLLLDDRLLPLIIIISLSILLFTSPCSAKDVYQAVGEKSCLLLSGGGILWTGGLYLDSRNKSPLDLQELSALSAADLNPVDRRAAGLWSPGAGTASNTLIGVMSLIPAALFLSPEIRKDALAVSVMYVETFLFAMGGAALAKGLCDRPRPFVYDPNPAVPPNEMTDADAARSFYSQHTALAFATAFFAAKVYSDYFPDSKYKTKVWAAAAGGAAAVGGLRIAAGKHFPTDVLTGAAAGGLTGYLIPSLHRGNGLLSVSPLLRGGIAGIAVTRVF